MIINEILDACSELKVEEKRVSAVDYEELVFFKKDMNQWYKNIDEILGPAVPVMKILLVVFSSWS